MDWYAGEDVYGRVGMPYGETIRSNGGLKNDGEIDMACAVKRTAVEGRDCKKNGAMGCGTCCF